MQEKDIVSDVLGGTKASINCYTTAIQECSNQQLRSALQTLRNEAEQMQYQIFKIAEQKGYYTPAPTANKNDINQIKSTLSSAVSNTTSAGTNQGQQMH